MIFDNQDQKEFVFKVLRAYVCPYAESLVINQKYAPAIQNGAVLSADEQGDLIKMKIEADAALKKKITKATEVTPPQPVDDTAKDAPADAPAEPIPFRGKVEGGNGEPVEQAAKEE